MFKIVFILLCLFSWNIWANTNVTCTHQEICRLITPLSHLNLKSIEIKNGDPHEFEPSSNQIKELLDADYLIVGPIELNPWIKNILTQRLNKNPNKTFLLKIRPNFIHDYQNGHLESLSHFWLYPKIYCDLKNQINQNGDLQKLNISADKNCDTEKTEIIIKNQLQKFNGTLVFSHDALAPFVRTYAPQIKFVTMKGSTHHEEVSAASLKALYNLRKQSQLTWIIEKNIILPETITSKIQKSDQIIYIDTAQSADSLNSTPIEFKNYPTLYKFIKSLVP